MSEYIKHVSIGGTTAEIVDYRLPDSTTSDTDKLLQVDGTGAFKLVENKPSVVGVALDTSNNSLTIGTNSIRVATVDPSSTVTTEQITAAVTAVSASGATQADFTKLHSVTASADELNSLTGSGVDSSDMSKLAAITASADEINSLTGSGVDTSDMTKLAAITATATELNVLDGVAGVTADDLNTLAGAASAGLTTTDVAKLANIDASFADINLLQGTQAYGLTTDDLKKLADINTTAAEINQLSGSNVVTADLQKLHQVTADASELNVLDGIPATLTATELGYMDGVTSSVQTQLDGKINNPSTKQSGNFLKYDGSDWVAAAIPDTGVLSVTATDSTITVDNTDTANPKVKVNEIAASQVTSGVFPETVLNNMDLSKIGTTGSTTIDGSKITAATIDTAQLKDGAVTSAKIANGTIVEEDLADDAVTSAKIATGAVSADALDADIIDGTASTTNKIATLSSIHDATLTIQAGGTEKGTFTANASTNATINITAADLGLTAVMTFIGVSTTDPKGTSGATVSGHTTWAKGEVVLYNNGEYVNLDGNNTAASWQELGSSGSYVLKTQSVSGANGLSGGGAMTSDLTISHATPTGAATTASGFYKFSTDERGHVNGTGAVTASDIPNLAASQITSGTFDADRIPNLDASKITSGTLDSGRIPSLGADNITDGSLTKTKLATSVQTSLGLADSALQSHQTVTLASGTDNGTLKLTTAAGTTDNISVKGIDSAAYKAEGYFIADPTTKADGQYLQYDADAKAWVAADVDALPTQSSTTIGKYLQTNLKSGSTTEYEASWQTINALPTQSATTKDKYLKTQLKSGSTTEYEAVWSDVASIEIQRISITATASQSTFDISGLGLSSTAGLGVYQNGLLLEPTTQYTATTSTVTLVGYTASAGDIFTFLGRVDTASGSYLSSSDITTGTTNGTISVKGTNITVKGLGSAAYTETSEYATAAQGALADSALQSHQTVTLASGTNNGTLKITTAAGTTDNIAVKGLGTAAYKAEGDFATASTAVTHTASTAVGSATQPVYVATDGTATACTYSLNATVPSTAVFTDHITTATASGSGNAVTAISADANGALTVTKGTTFLTSHQDISGKQDKVAALGSASTPIYTSAAGTFAACTSSILGYPTASSFGTAWNTEYRLGSVSSCSLTLPSPVTTMTQEIRITFTASAAFTPAFTMPSGYTALGTSDLSATTSGKYYEISCATIDSSHIAIAMKEWS